MRTTLHCFLLLLTLGCPAGAGIDDPTSNQGPGGTVSSGPPGNSGAGASTASFNDPTGGSAGGPPTSEPKTCEEAAAAKSYVGCEFWPTVTANGVWEVFDFAVVVANTGEVEVEVTVDRGGSLFASESIPVNGLATIYLPWITELKGPEVDSRGGVGAITQSMRVPNGAYHLSSSHPVTVYQFNALEYAPREGRLEKTGHSVQPCCPVGPMECFSCTNDASLLLPATAQTGNFRVPGYYAVQAGNQGAFMSMTGFEDGTEVNVALGPAAQSLAGPGIGSAGFGGQLTLSLNRARSSRL